MSAKKPVCLTLKKKAEILDFLQKGSSVTYLAKKYNVAKSTICGIKAKRNVILKCVNNTFSGPGKRKTLRTSELPKMEKSLYRWFLCMRNKNWPVSALMLKEKAKKLHSKFKEKEGDFYASDGWFQGFKKRYGIRLLQISGEKLSSQSQLVDPFKEKLKDKIAEFELCNDQLYNADESGLFWKLLPEKTYVSTLEKRAPGVKSEKQRITFLCCSNATGSHKLKLLVIGKAKNPRCFKNLQCPTNYKNSKSAWMTATIFKEWFHQSFVPQVKSFLKEKNLPIKALLLIDNAPSHPNEAELTTEDGQIFAMFMPPNVTPLIQPMDQNAIKITKLYYRNSLTSIAATQSDLLESMKKITLKSAINFLEAAWSRVGKEILSKCWKNILNFTVNDDDLEDSMPLAILKEKWETELRSLMCNTADLLNSLNAESEFTLSNVKEWNEDIDEDNAHDDIGHEDEPDEDCISEASVKIIPSEAVEIFNKAIQWASHEGVDQKDMNVLRRLRENAVFQVLERKKTQKKMTDFFK
ncbi:jerky protein homolog-like [Teleopsis dalmanni]|uniref:jerky protein homolog-like n=1 Tax=Teleopsis dalmanni TaxID=139649 RepID=UPI0018CEDBD0|nr:jerky protein homolog-like [Teleopsis dalmanni]